MSFNIINYGSFAILTLSWLDFGAALLGTVWQLFRGLPLVAQIVLGLLLLPVVLGLWIWQTPWPLWIRVVLVIGLGFATIYTFFSRQS